MPIMMMIRKVYLLGDKLEREVGHCYLSAPTMIRIELNFLKQERPCCRGILTASLRQNQFRKNAEKKSDADIRCDYVDVVATNECCRRSVSRRTILWFDL